MLTTTGLRKLLRSKKIEYSDVGMSAGIPTLVLSTQGQSNLVGYHLCLIRK